MLIALNRDQELFRETTARLLSERVPVEELRRLRDDPGGYDDEYWRRGADLGWTSLLVSEDHGGGSIGGQGLVDLALVAYEFGRHAAPGSAGRDQRGRRHPERDRWQRVGGGDRRVAVRRSRGHWCFAEPPPDDRLDAVSLEIRVEGDDVVLNGVKRPVESGASGRPPAGLRAHRRRTDPGARARRDRRACPSRPCRPST